MNKDKEMKMIGDEWTNMCETDRVVWNEKAKKEKIRYLMEMERYKENAKKKRSEDEDSEPTYEVKPLIEV